MKKRTLPLTIALLVVFVSLAALAGTIVWGAAANESASSDGDYVVWGT